MSSFFNNLSLKTKLLFMMLFLSLLSIGLLFFIYARVERAMITEVKRYTEELSVAIQISMEQATKMDEELNDVRLKEYVGRFKNKGIKDISILSNENEVIASSNPGLIGKVFDIKGERIKSPGNIKEYLTTSGGYRNYDILLPVIVGDDQLGYIHIAMRLDDFADLLKSNHLKRLIATGVVFAVGIVVSIFLSAKYTQPVHRLVDAARKVASGDLTEIMEVKGRDEIGELNRSFNEMIKGLKEMKEMEERLRHAEHLSRIGQLSSGIAHEIRNPLNFINLSIDHLKAKYTPVENKEEFIRLIHSIKGEIRRLNRMVNNFLKFGKPLKLNIRMASPTKVIEEVIALAEEKIIERGIKVELSLKEKIPKIPMDSEQIKICLMNLFINSLQAMPQGGKLTVETALNNNSVSIITKDTGVGIVPEHINEVFEPYFTTKDSGIGLGLAITKRIIEEHRGRINISSEPGRGTIATIELPLIEGV